MFESYLIEGTKYTPEIKFHHGILEINGVSIPENASSFYEPLNTAIEKYCNVPNSETTINISLFYFNTSSLKSLLALFSLFEKIHNKRSRVKVNWYYDANDDDFIENINVYEEVLKIDFRFIPVSGWERPKNK